MSFINICICFIVALATSQDLPIASHDRLPSHDGSLDSACHIDHDVSHKHCKCVQVRIMKG